MTTIRVYRENMHWHENINAERYRENLRVINMNPLKVYIHDHLVDMVKGYMDIVARDYNTGKIPLEHSLPVFDVATNRLFFYANHAFTLIWFAIHRDLDKLRAEWWLHQNTDIAYKIALLENLYKSMNSAVDNTQAKEFKEPTHA